MRVLVYVNENPTEKHITIHCEKKGPCSHVFQQLISGNTQMNLTIQDLSQGRKEAIKIAETENAYWILLWVNTYDAARNHNIIQHVAGELGVQPRTCQHCC